VRGGRNACVDGGRREKKHGGPECQRIHAPNQGTMDLEDVSLAPLLTFPADEKTVVRETKRDPNSSIQVKECIQMIALYKNGSPDHDARIQKPTELVAQMYVAVAVCAYAVAVAVSLGSVVYAVSTAVLVL
jgi:hypothetical protein